MNNPLGKKDMCMIQCQRCDKPMHAEDERILSVYDHEPICMTCRGEEEKRPDYEEVSRNMVGMCMIDVEMAYSMDTEGYCYHHFNPYTCN